MARVRDAVEILDGMGDLGFEYDGEMAVDVALNPEARRLYPFCRLTGPANVLVMPAVHSAAISTKMAAALGGATVIGPILVGLQSSVQIAQLDATAADIVNLAAFAAYNPNA
jgi:malate dehydrogenase (oxaloacetate-decarboxylating)(NADP+)